MARRSKPLTERQKTHRKYLLTDHWKSLRSAALDRDGNRCCKCGSTESLNVHHEMYRGRLEDGVLEDVTTLCRECHRMAHGLWCSTSFDRYKRKMEDIVNTNILPSQPQVRELVFHGIICGQEDEALAYLRHLAGMRIILTSTKRWESWLSKPVDVWIRVWPWAESKLERIKNQLISEGEIEHVR